MPEGAGDVMDVNGVQLQLSVPQKLHLFVGVFVNSTNDQTGHDVVQAARTVHEARADNNVVKSIC